MNDDGIEEKQREESGGKKRRPQIERIGQRGNRLQKEEKT